MTATAEVFAARDGWTEEYRSGWLSHFKGTGEIDWSLYPKTPSLAPVSGAAVDLSRSRLLLVSSAGAYQPGQHTPFEAADPLGDYSLRSHETADLLDSLAFAHDHYDHAAVEEDRGVLLPMDLLRAGVAEGRIGEVTPQWVSFMGYQPDLTRVSDETLPLVLEAARESRADTALLVPS
jgi:Glycine/sarcosine/betaine reductase selenoprotein B (GRDB)